MTPLAAIGGAVAGLVGAVLPGWVSHASLAQGLLQASFPTGVPSLAPFLGALVASSLVSLLLLSLGRSRA